MDAPISTREGQLPFKNRKIYQRVDFVKVPSFEDILYKHYQTQVEEKRKEAIRQENPYDYLNKVEIEAQQQSEEQFESELEKLLKEEYLPEQLIQEAKDEVRDQIREQEIKDAIKSYSRNVKGESFNDEASFKNSIIKQSIQSSLAQSIFTF